MLRFFILLFLFYAVSLKNVFGQKISEHSFAVGLSKTSSKDFRLRWNNSTSPTFIVLNLAQSWYNNSHKVSLRKEIGLDFQYAGIDLAGGGLGAGNHYTGRLLSAFVNPALMAHLKVTSKVAVAMGPIMEFLIIGSDKLNNSYFTAINNPPSSGDIETSGLNRDYFYKPFYGLKLMLMQAVTENKTMGISLSYLWTESDPSNFYASNYARLSFVFGFHKKAK